MEQEKNLERSEQTAEAFMNGTFQNLSLDNSRRDSMDDDQLLEVQTTSPEESGNEDDILPENMVLSFSTTTDEELLQKEYDMLSRSTSCNDVGDEREGTPGYSGGGMDGEILNGVYFDKLELELNAIEHAMSQFEGRLDLLREQAQDLLLTLQSDRVLPEVEGKSAEVGLLHHNTQIQEKGSGDDS